MKKMKRQWYELLLPDPEMLRIWKKFIIEVRKPNEYNS